MYGVGRAEGQGVTSLSKLDGEGKTKTNSEKGIRKGKVSREIMPEAPQRDPGLDPERLHLQSLLGNQGRAHTFSSPSPFIDHYSSLQSPEKLFPGFLGSPTPEPDPGWKFGGGVGRLENPSHLPENFLSLSLWSGGLGPLSPLPPYPIEFLASGSWRQLGRPTNFSPGHFLTPPTPHPRAFFSFPLALFERRHPGSERVLQFNYFQILCSGHPGTPLSAIESRSGRAGAPLPGRA